MRAATSATANQFALTRIVAQFERHETTAFKQIPAVASRLPVG